MIVAMLIASAIMMIIGYVMYFVTKAKPVVYETEAMKRNADQTAGNAAVFSMSFVLFLLLLIIPFRPTRELMIISGTFILAAGFFLMRSSLSDGIVCKVCSVIGGLMILLGAGMITIQGLM